MTQLITILASTSSTLEKENILEEYTTDTDARVFKLAYDPYKRYNLHFDYVDMSNLGEANLDMFILLNKIACKEITGNAAREAVINYSESNGDLIKLICNKDLRCGVSATTLNKVFGNTFINKFNIQLAKDESIDKIKFPILGQIKYNGARVLAICNNDEVALKSRGGHEFNFPALNKLLSNLNFNYVLDGELTFGDSKNEDHTKVSGLINSSIKTGAKIPDNIGLVFNIFDVIPLHEFEQNICNAKYSKRLEKVKIIVNEINNEMVKAAKTITFNNKDDLSSTYSTLLESGYEGLILKSANHFYTYKKNKNWIKMKATETADLMCTEIKEGTGKYEGMIGSLVCEGFVENNKYYCYVNVGSGLSDADRKLDPQYYIGKTIEVKYNKVIADTNTSSWSLFLPRFKCVRLDKS